MQPARARARVSPGVPRDLAPDLSSPLAESTFLMVFMDRLLVGSCALFWGEGPSPSAPSASPYLQGSNLTERTCSLSQLRRRARSCARCPRRRRRARRAPCARSSRRRPGEGRSNARSGIRAVAGEPSDVSESTRVLLRVALGRVRRGLLSGSSYPTSWRTCSRRPCHRGRTATERLACSLASRPIG